MGRQKYSTSEPGSVKDFAGRPVGLEVTYSQGAVWVRPMPRRALARPCAHGFYRAIRMMRDASVKRVLKALPQKVMFSLSWERRALGT